MAAAFAPDGVESLEALGPGLWRGRMGGRPVVVRELPVGDVLPTAEQLKRLDCPELPRLLDARQRDGPAWAVFEFAEGETLARRLDREGALAPPAALDVVRAAARALEALGRAGLRHGAIRPTNIVFDARGGVRFVDPVWSRPAPLEYQSPEEARGAGRPDLRSDLYSLGLVLHEMLLGMPAFVTRDPAALRELHARGRLRFDIDGLPPALVEAGQRLTEPDPDRRLASPAELLRILDGVERPAPTPAPAPAPFVPSGPPPRRRRGVLVPLLVALALFVGLPLWVIRLALQEAKPKPKPAPRVVIAPLPKPVLVPLPKPPPRPVPVTPPPPRVFTPEEVAAERARAESFLASADELAALRDYDRLDALTPDLKSPEGRARLDEVLSPHRRAARAWRAALAQLAAMKGRLVNVTLRFGGTRLYGKLEAVELPKLRVGATEASVKDLDAASVARLAMSGPGAATDLEVLAFAIFEGDAATARLAAEDVEPDPWAAPRLAALVKAADDQAAREKRERAADLALRSADRAYKDYRPELWWDVADQHPGTAAGKSALEKVTALRTSLARWSFNDGQSAGWTGELLPNGRWGRGGFHLKAPVKDGVAAAERRSEAPAFAWSKAARLRFDVRLQAKGRLTVTLEGEGGVATASMDSTRTATWQAFDRPLAEFEGGAFEEGRPICSVRVEARGEAAPQVLLLDSIEVYTPK
jgi:hypothetical protein